MLRLMDPSLLAFACSRMSSVPHCPGLCSLQSLLTLSFAARACSARKVAGSAEQRRYRVIQRQARSKQCAAMGNPVLQSPAALVQSLFQQAVGPGKPEDGSWGVPEHFAGLLQQSSAHQVCVISAHGGSCEPLLTQPLCGCRSLFSGQRARSRPSLRPSASTWAW